MKILTLLLFSSLSFSLNAHSKQRAIITFKSQVGFAAMKQYFEKSESKNNIRYLVSAQKMIIVINQQLDIEKLKVHPEVQSVVMESFFNPFDKNNKQISAPNPNAQSRPVTFTFKNGPKTPWGILAIKAPQAWSSSFEGSLARVLVVDTGVQLDHPAIKKNIESAKNFTANTVTGIVDATDVREEFIHGTHVAGTIAAEYNSKTGFVGVAPDAKLLFAKVCTQTCSDVSIAEGIYWGIEQRVDIINISLGDSQSPNEILLEALASAEAANILITAAAGNNYCKHDSVDFPGKVPTVMAIGAVDEDLNKTAMSSCGPELALMAPGESVLSSMVIRPDTEVQLFVNGIGEKIQSSFIMGLNKLSAPLRGEVIYVGDPTPESFLKFDVKGKLALVHDSQNARAIGKNALAAGALGILIIQTSLEDLVIPTPHFAGNFIRVPAGVIFTGATIEKISGDKIIQLLQMGQKVEADIAVTSVGSNRYESWDGTSMAAPHVAGVAALAIGAFKKTHPGRILSVKDLRKALMNQALPHATEITNNYGAGFVQADKTIEAVIKF